MVEKAYRLAFEAHKDQKRKSGEPYIIHPLCVAIILADLELDKETIVAGILHDVVEDTVMTTDGLAREFGAEVALLVDGVTKLTNISWDKDKVEMQAENLRKMSSPWQRISGSLNQACRPASQYAYLKVPDHGGTRSCIARETQEIYCPIAQRLGISKIKIELDDLSLKYLEPEAYYDLVRQIDQRKSVRDDYVQSLVEEVRAHIKAAGIVAEIEGRAKHFFQHLQEDGESG